MTQEEHPVDQTLLALKAMAWTASLPFKGHFCPETDDFKASLETEYDLFQYTTSVYKGSKHIIRSTVGCAEGYFFKKSMKCEYVSTFNICVVSYF